MKSAVKIFSLLLFCGCSCWCYAQTASGKIPENSVPAKMQAAAVNAGTDEYIIGSEDVLAVNIWKEPEMSRTLPVRPDGKITLPLVGDIQASGLTPHKLQDNITSDLRSYVSSPAVTVIVQEVKSLKFNVVGEITRPGAYPLHEPMTVLDAIAVGGGLKDFAKGSRIYVLRLNGDGSHSRLPFDYKNVIKGKKLSENVELRRGDTIVVP